MFTEIERFKNSFLNPGGIHQPKKLDCICSDGVTRSLLLKVKKIHTLLNLYTFI